MITLFEGFQQTLCNTALEGSSEITWEKEAAQALGKSAGAREWGGPCGVISCLVFCCLEEVLGCFPCAVLGRGQPRFFPANIVEFS